MSNSPILLLRLEGMLQSWGERSRFNQRDTAFMPTKSGIIGLIACAMGLERGSPQIVNLCNSLKMSVRADRPGVLLRDYHTVMGNIMTASGKLRGKVNEDSTIVTARHYLQDASFLVALSGDEDILERCNQALQSPVWQIFLGRKSCVPSCPVSIGIVRDYASLDDVMYNYPVRRGAQSIILCEIEDSFGEILRNDIPTVAPMKTYNSRSVKMHAMKPGVI